MTQMRPMLAAQKYREAGDLWGPKHEQVVLQHLKEDGYLIVQPKWDGFRGILEPNKRAVLSRSWKPLANPHLQRWAHEASFKYPELSFIDGETFPGHEYHSELFRNCMSDLRSGTGTNKLMWVLYDYPRFPNMSYRDRRNELIDKVFLGADSRSIDLGGAEMLLMLCPQMTVTSLEALYEEEQRLVGLNFEGAIVRRPHKPYKYNRATALGGELVKVKRRITVDAIVTGFEQRFENQNEAKTSELGYTTRSAHQENLHPLEMLGALHIRLLESGIEQKVGVFRGLTHEDLRTLWTERESLIGRHCEVSTDSAAGGYDASRCPVWIRWRDTSEF